MGVTSAASDDSVEVFEASTDSNTDAISVDADSDSAVEDSEESSSEVAPLSDSCAVRFANGMGETDNEVAAGPGENDTGTEAEIGSAPLIFAA